MQGLLNSGMNAEEGARPQQMPGGGQQARPQRGEARPQEGRQAPGQAGQNGVDMDPSVAGEQLNTLVNSMLGQLYGDQLEPAARILRQSANDPVEAIGRVVTGLIGAVYKAVRDQGRAIPPGVMFQAAMVAAQAVGEMAMRMGIIDESNEADVVESAFMLALGNFGRANAEQMSDAERERYGQLIDGMEEGKRMAMGGPQMAGGNAETPAGNMPQGGA